MQKARKPYRRVLPPEFESWREKAVKLLNVMMEERGFTQQMVAEEAPCSSSTVSNLLHGVTKDPWSSTFFKIARTVGLEIRLGLNGAQFKKVPPKIQKAIPPPKETAKPAWMSSNAYRALKASRN